MLARIIVPLALAVTATLPLHAGSSDAMQLSGQVYREIVARDGNGAVRRTLMPASRLTSGDRLVFVIRYSNLGSAPVGDYIVASPFPATVRYDDNPRQPVEVSVDGGRSWGRFAAVTRASMGPGADRVTNVRLRLRAAVQPGETGQMSYRGVVR